MFKIQIPLSDYQRLDKYYSLGLKNKLNFYGGYDHIDWSKFGGLTNTNGRFHKGSSYENFKLLKKSIEYIEGKGDKFCYTFNALPSISDNELMTKHINFINNKLKPRSIIMNDPIFSKKINKNIDIHISTLAGLHNIENLNYWLKNDLNVRRLIFPREIQIKDVDNICGQYNNIDFEILIKDSRCYLSNSHCGSSHTVKGQKNLCMREKDADNYYGILNKDNLKKIYGLRLSCKVCQIYKFKERFVNSKTSDMYLKIVGRERKIDGLIKDAKFIDEVIENCKKAKNFKEFIALNIFKHKVIYGETCYYGCCEFYKGSEEI